MALDNLFTPINPGSVEISNRCVWLSLGLLFTPKNYA